MLFRIKIRNIDDLQELSEIIESSSDAKAVSRISCTDDGQLTAVSTEGPALVVYLTIEKRLGKYLDARKVHGVELSNSLASLTISISIGDVRSFELLCCGFSRGP